MRRIAVLLGLVLAALPIDASATPLATRAVDAAWSVQGDTSCVYGARDCNRCVDDVVGAVQSLRPSARVRYSSRTDSPLPPFGRRLAAFASHTSHLQGISRVPGSPGDHWLVASRARPGRVGGGGFFLVELGDVAGRGGAAFGTADVPLHTVRLDPARRRTAYYYPVDAVDHPGGVQMLGTTLALAASCSDASACEGRAFVELHDLRKPGSAETLVTRVPLFRHGEPHARRHASSVALARLADGHHLMYVHGKDDRPEGWFYRTLAPGLGNDTRWAFVERFAGGRDFDGRYQNVAFLTECGTGDLYLVATGNPRFGAPILARTPAAFARGLASLVSSGRPSRGREMLDLFRLARVDGALRAERVHAERFEPDRGGYCSFRAGASLHVTPDGGIALYCSAYKANTDWLGAPDGKLKLLELSAEPRWSPSGEVR